MLLSCIFLCFALVGGATMNDYCMARPLGTPCRTRCARSKACGFSHDRFIPLTDEERTELIHRHNQLRKEVTLGEHVTHNIPLIPHMNIISYDRELEFLAACWILQCNFSAEDARYRRTLKDRPYNQLLYRYATPTAELYPPGFLTHGVSFWFSQWRHLSPLSDLESNASEAVEGVYLHHTEARKIGHLSQLLWPNTRYIGCAKMHHKHRRSDNRLVLDHGYNLVCNYEPPVDSDKAAAMRKTLDSVDVCMLKQDRHLCGEFRQPNEDTYSAPINFQTYNNCHRMKVNALLALLLSMSVNVI